MKRSCLPGIICSVKGQGAGLLGEILQFEDYNHLQSPSSLRQSGQSHFSEIKKIREAACGDRWWCFMPLPLQLPQAKGTLFTTMDHHAASISCPGSEPRSPDGIAQWIAISRPRRLDELLHTSRLQFYKEHGDNLVYGNAGPGAEWSPAHILHV
jgi:hypothetical protein